MPQYISSILAIVFVAAANRPLGATGSDDHPADVYPTEIELSARSSSISMAEPFVFRLTYVFDEPRIPSDGSEPCLSVVHRAQAWIETVSGEPVCRIRRLSPLTLNLERTDGTLYSGQFSLMHDPATLKPIFTKPGSYRLTVGPGGNYVSKALAIAVVAASPKEEEALSMLADPKTVVFIECGQFDNPADRAAVVDCLTRLIDRHPQSALGRWAAARLGIDAYNRFIEQHKGFVHLSPHDKQLAIQEPLFDDAGRYLSHAQKLQDAFPLREEVLFRLSSVFFAEGRFDASTALLEELEAKYPTGRLARFAPELRAERQRMIDSGLVLSADEGLTGDSSGWVWQVALVTGVGAVAVVLSVLLIKTRCRASR